MWPKSSQTKPNSGQIKLSKVKNGKRVDRRWRVEKMHHALRWWRCVNFTRRSVAENGVVIGSVGFVGEWHP